MGFLAIVGAVTIGLIGLGGALVLCSIAWGYAQAIGGFVRATKIARRYGDTLWKPGFKPRFFAIRMIHWQVWHQCTWELGGLDVPWTFAKPVKRGKRRYPA